MNLKSVKQLAVALEVLNKLPEEQPEKVNRLLKCLTQKNKDFEISSSKTPMIMLTDKEQISPTA